jgi:hypothetical protein
VEEMREYLASVSAQWDAALGRLKAFVEEWDEARQLLLRINSGLVPARWSLSSVPDTAGRVWYRTSVWSGASFPFRQWGLQPLVPTHGEGN